MASFKGGIQTLAGTLDFQGASSLEPSVDVRGGLGNSLQLRRTSKRTPEPGEHVSTGQRGTGGALVGEHPWVLLSTLL